MKKTNGTMEPDDNGKQHLQPHNKKNYALNISRSACPLILITCRHQMAQCRLTSEMKTRCCCWIVYYVKYMKNDR